MSTNESRLGGMGLARVVSLIVLVVILLVIGGLFFRLMSSFILPMFLAVLLVTMFSPLHRWLKTKCNSHDRIAAGLTTAAILLIFLIPLALIFLEAASEGIQIYQGATVGSLDINDLAKDAAKFGNDASAHVPFIETDFTAESIEKSVHDALQKWLAPLAVSTTHFLGSFFVGLAIMVISLYYFLADGPGMIRTIVSLLPLDNRYQEQLLSEFERMTRAVVIATIAAAFGQGLLAGLAYYFVGLEAVFLLTALTMLFALVPFVGSTVVWVPATLWLYFHDGRTFAAIILAVYMTTIVSLADNIIKPLILHGQANLHPLLALLSVLGGVQALGPIGIFVGPMVVTFLQTLLNMLHTEIDEISENPAK